MIEFEKNGEKYNRDTFFAARVLCADTLKTISEKLTVGMNEADVQRLIKDEFAARGIFKFWHPSKFRIGSDTTKSFRELSDQQIRLTESEIYFIDIGPIIENHEADLGESFVFGNPNGAGAIENQKLANGAKQLWYEVADIWQKEKISGIELYRRAQVLAARRGYKLNTQMDGHRIGDFPHALYCQDGLAEMSLVPSADLWVLEIHILDLNRARGAFFEDVLSY